MGNGKHARKTNPPDRIQVNKAGALSVLSVVRYLELPDDVTFKVTYSKGKKLTLTPITTEHNDDAAEEVRTYTIPNRNNERTIPII